MNYIRGPKILLVLAVIILTMLYFPVKGYITQLTYRMDNYLPNNFYVDDVNIGRRTVTEAIEQIDNIARESLKKNVRITYDDNKGNLQKISFTKQQLGYYIDKKNILSDIQSLMDKNANIFKRIISYKKIENSRKDYKLDIRIDYNKFSASLNAFDGTSLKPPSDAKYNYNNGKIEIINEEPGYVFDKETLYKELSANTNLSSAMLLTKSVMPSVTTEQLSKQGIKEKISGFTTRFDAGNAPRASNIRLAAKIIEGTVLAPGDTFSFNEVVGQRTEERGFKEAGVYMNGKVDTGIGGGICQVSTTLYNSILFADLEVLERHNHSLTVPYVPLSRDAAVSWGLQDFKFINNTDYYIYIHASTTRNTITFELFSTNSEKKVELISTTFNKVKAPVLYKDDETIEVGKLDVEEPGHDGFESQLTKKVYVNGKLVSTGIVSKDKYLTSPKVVIRGTKLPIIYPPNLYHIYE